MGHKDSPQVNENSSHLNGKKRSYLQYNFNLIFVRKIYKMQKMDLN